MGWYLEVLRRYADFSGRARRREYWMFTLITTIISAGLVVIDRQTGMTAGPGGSGFADQVGVLTTVYYLATLLPTLAVGARRLHDQGLTGWLQLIVVIPLLGWVALIVLMALDGHRGSNAHGADPKELAPA